MPNIRRTPDPEPLLTPAEVAAWFKVDVKTVSRWAKAGKLTSIRTLGGHRRYRETEVRDLLNGTDTGRTAAAPASAPAAVPADGTCPECRYPLGSMGHRTAPHNRAA